MATHRQGMANLEVAKKCGVGIQHGGSQETEEKPLQVMQAPHIPVR